MVLPPNRIGGTRGPNGSTLDDVVAAIQETNIALGELGVQISSQNAFLNSLANDVQRLVGPAENLPSNWLGFPAALGTPPVNAQSETFWQMVIGIAFAVNDIQSSANGSEASLTAILDAIGLRGQQPVGANVNILQQMDYARQRVDALYLVAGQLTDAPTGSTLKDLLRSIDVNQLRAADCCEENSNQEPPTETQPPGPEDSCPLSGGPLRTTGYFFWRNLPAEELDEYIPLWDGLEAASSGLVAPLNSFDAAPIPAIYAPEFLANVCFEWNLLDGQVPGQLAQYRSSSTGEFVGETPTLISVTIGGGSSSVYLLDPEDRPRVFTVRVAEGSGAPTHNNYWLRWEANPV